MDKKEKNLIIDECIRLFNVAKNMPIFQIYYEVKAPTKDIEDFMIKSYFKQYDESELRESEKIEYITNEMIPSFKKSDDYEFEKGMSKATLTACFTIETISFDKIKDIIENIPIKNGEFVKFLDYIIDE